ncbi:amidase [Lentibacillus sp. N15]|uniref:amidase n=1 Tax=Lentibacillus songyuanensis TaxID=3136161 RepID=UPI0031BBB722
MDRLTETKTILTMDVTTLAKRIKNREIRSVDAVLIYINHLATINKKVYCVVAERFADALEEAKQCDEMLDQGEGVGRLFGVPISVKESFDVQGMKTTGGFKHRANYTATVDAEVVQRLKAEGAIILCKTNTSTADLTFESINKQYGRTNNPWNLSRTAGGSSGGEAALIACGGAAVGIGSDLAGSLRLPGHFNGVLAFKSGAGDVSMSGHFPKPIHPLQDTMFGIGALGKSVQDLKLIYSTLSNRRPAETDIHDFRLIMPMLPSTYPLSNDTENGWQMVQEFFNGKVHMENGEMPDFIAKLPLLHLEVLTIGGAKDLYPAFFAKKSFPLAKTMLREAILHDTSYYYYFLKTMMLAKAGSNVFRTKRGHADKLKTKQDQFIAAGNRLLDKAVMVLPVYPTPAKKHGQLDRELFSNRFSYLKLMPYTVLPNALGYPALSVPIAMSEQGLPISVQLVSKQGNENALFYFGRQLEQSFLGYHQARP